MMNFVWTAWHLYQHVWRGIQALPTDERERLQQSLGAVWSTETEFRDWAKQECPELGACRQLSNTVKHPGGECDVPPDEPVADIAASAKATASVAPGVPLWTIGLAEHWVHKIKYGEQWQLAEVVFVRVVAFWTRVMGYGCNISW